MPRPSKKAAAKPERASKKTTKKAATKPVRAPKTSTKKAATAKPARASKKTASKPEHPSKKASKKAPATKPAGASRKAAKKSAKKATTAATGLRAFAEECEMGYVVHAFRADLDTIVGAVKAQPEFVAHARDVGVSSLAQAASPRLGERERSTFLVEFDGSPWRLWYGATNWLKRADSRLARLAARVAQQLAVRAICVSASDEAGEIQVFDEGEQVGGSEDELEDLLGPEAEAIFADADLWIPPAFIGDHPVALFLDDAVLPRVSRVDRLDLRAPEGKKERVRHPFTGKMVEMEFD
jgi:hypothetical protein